MQPDAVLRVYDVHMKRPIGIVATILVAYVLVAGISGLIVKSVLSGSDVVGGLQSRLPVQFETDEVGLDFVEWFKFRPTIALRGLRVKNAEGFPSEHILTADGVGFRVRLLPLLKKQIEVPSVTIEGPTLHIDRNEAGKTNLDVVKERLGQVGATSETNEAAEAGQAPSLALESLRLSGGALRYADAGNRDVDLNIDEVSIELTDFTPGESTSLDFSARLFHADDSRIAFVGAAGPFAATSIPADGDLELSLNPDTIPEAMRVENFGNLLRLPGSDGLIRLAAKLKGDLLAAVEGEGTLLIENLLVGKDAASRIPIEGELPLTLNVKTPLTDPDIDLKTQRAQLGFSDGRWQGAAEVRYRNGLLQGRSNGAVSGFNIEQVMNAFTTAGDAVFGRAEVPSYQIRFAGRDAEQIKNSMKGRADLKLSEGKISMLNLAQTIEKHWNKALNGTEPATGTTDFADFATRLIFEDQKIRLPELALDASGMRATGSGFVTFDKELDFDLNTWLPIQNGGPAALLTLATNAETMQVPVRITGSLDSPKARPAFGKIVKQQATKTATSVLGSILGGFSAPAEGELEGEPLEAETTSEGASAEAAGDGAQPAAPKAPAN